MPPHRLSAPNRQRRCRFSGPPESGFPLSVLPDGLPGLGVPISLQNSVVAVRCPQLLVCPDTLGSLGTGQHASRMLFLNCFTLFPPSSTGPDSTPKPDKPRGNVNLLERISPGMSQMGLGHGALGCSFGSTGLLRVERKVMIKMGMLTVDAALNLVEQYLPTARVALVQQPDGSWRATILWKEQDFRHCPEVYASTAPLAIASALLAALAANTAPVDS